MYQGIAELLVEKQDKILLVTFNNPKKKNCLNGNAYAEIGRILRTVAEDDAILMVVFTGVGDFFTAGNDISQTGVVDDIDEHLKKASATFKEMISAFIDCPKVLLALINGPCIGIGTTLAALCDFAWCAETSYFLTPFTKLGIVPEAGSSYLFPLILGRSKATEMLLFSQPITATEALEYKLVSKVFKMSELNSVVWPKIREFAAMAPESVRISKRLMRMHDRDALYRALNAESDELHKRFYSEEFMHALIEFSMRKSASKL